LILKHDLIKNVAALSVLQGVSYLLPLITLPYLTRTLGVEEWGRVTFVQLIIGYFCLVTNWGFPWSSARKVAIARNSNAHLSEIFAVTWTAQWFIAIISVFVLLLLVAVVPFFQKDRVLYIYGVGLVISGVMFPSWFLAGLERMQVMASIQIFARIVSVPLVFVFIHDKDDSPMIIAIGAITSLISGLWMMLWIKFKLEIFLVIPTPIKVWREIRESSVIFLSTIWISAYTTLIPTVLGIVAGHEAVGFYNLADRIRNVGQGFIGPVSQALFPRMNYLFANDSLNAKRLLLRSGLIISSISGLVSLSLWVAAEPIVVMLGGRDFLPASNVLRWLAPLPFVIGISSIASLQILIPMHRERNFHFVVFIGAMVSLLTLHLLVLDKGAVGAGQAMLIVESIVCVGMWINARNALMK